MDILPRGKTKDQYRAAELTAMIESSTTAAILRHCGGVPYRIPTEGSKEDEDRKAVTYETRSVLVCRHHLENRSLDHARVVPTAHRDRPLQ